MSESAGMTAVERATQAFYEWEVRGRGWTVWDERVVLEPPFRPFLGHRVESAAPVDDGRKHTLVSALVEKVRHLVQGRPEPKEPETLRVPPEWLEDRPPDPEAEDYGLREFSAQLPAAESLSPDALERWLVGLPVSGPASFDLFGTEEAIHAGFACREDDATAFADSARAYLPGLALVGAPDRLLDTRVALPDPASVVVDFGLSHEFMLPLATGGRLDPDPLTGVVAALESLGPGELGLFQVLFQPARHPWTESLLRAVRDPRGGAFFADCPEMLPLAKEKASRPLFAVAVRVAGTAPEYDRAWAIARSLGAALAPLARPTGNELIPLADEDYPPDEHEVDVYRRATRRSGMLLNSAELVGLVHVPGPGVHSERLARLTRRTKAAPEPAQDASLVLGSNPHAGEERPVALAPAERLRHVHIVGASGTGKSTLLLSLVLQDIEAGRGVGLLDPHGDLVDEIVGRIPAERRNEVVLVDPSDERHTVPFNVLAAHSEAERTLLASDLGAVFRRLATSWGDQMTTVLGNAILAILEHPDGGTLVTLRRFLADAAFRKDYLAGVRDPEVVFFWEKEFPILRGASQASILTRLNTFLRPRPIRAMVSHRENRIDFRGIMDRGQIFLVKLAHGLLGEENADFLGSLLVAKFHQTALSRQEEEAARRRPFFLYLDEFQNFVTPSMASILSGARKYGLGLTLAHQDLRQLEGARDVAGAVLANPGTRICFRLGDADARALESGFASFTRQDLQSLSVGEAIARIDRADRDFNLATLPAPAVESEAAASCRAAVVEASRRRHAVPIPEPEVPEVARVVEEAPGASPPAKPRSKVERTRRTSDSVASPLPEEEETPGRGGKEHSYLQQLVARLGQNHGYRATLEQPIADGAARVDVALEREGHRIACQISVTSRAGYEAEKALTCLEAGFDGLVVVASRPRTLRALQKAIRARLGEESDEHLSFLSPEEIPAFFEALAQPDASEAVVRGYRVTVRHRTDPGADERQRRVAGVIARSLKRLKED